VNGRRGLWPGRRDAASRFAGGNDGSNFVTQGSIGALLMDLTAICPTVDNLNTGTATCLNNTPSPTAFAP